MSKNKTKTIEQKYQKKDLREHILLRPDSYVGSVSKVTEEMWVLVKGSFVKKPVTFSKALLSIFDELLVNALDHSTKESVKKIEINVNGDEISVGNDGPGIPTDYHKEHNMYVPELVFGNLLTGSNYDDSEERFTGGRNGYGAKCTNIYSNYFKVETQDGTNKYTQVWRNNMTECDPPVIKKQKGKSFTKITFIPDLPRFGFKKLSKDIVSLLEKRAYDACACTNKNIKVYFNGDELKVKEFKRYIDLYIGPERKNEEQESVKRIYLHKEKKNGAIWEVGIAMNPDPDSKFQQVSFVNGICTDKGGKHVDYIGNQIITKLLEILQKKKSTVTRGWLRDRLFIFLRTTIVNPKFTSQTKEELETPSSEFQFEFKLEQIDPKVFDKIGKLGILEEALSFAKYKETRELAKKSDGKKKNRIYGITKLQDAVFAGTAKSQQCTLLLVEGDSAAAFVKAGVSVLKNGRECYGVYPLKGKLVNVKSATTNTLINNNELLELKQILGLKQEKKYTSTKDLRYGKVMMVCDQDDDGIHIKGLAMNIFHTWWPELLKMDFIQCLATPLVKVTKGKTVNEFYTMVEFDDWKKNKVFKKSEIKYYKGLATSTQKEAKDMFRNGIEDKKIVYQFDKYTDKSMNLAFSKLEANGRKEWLGNYNRDLILTQSEKKPSITEFINKELIHFSISDVSRSIPSMVDGFKPSQRKVLFGCFKRNLVSEIKVAQLGGYISEHTDYHHGEVSLHETIIKMAQSFVGSNNIPLLEEHGMFGTRETGGKNAGSPRYIFTCMKPILKKIFHPDDLSLITYNSAGTDQIEPEFYIPIIPMVLVNGSVGIGTGFSCNVYSYNPKDIVLNLYNLMEGKPQVEMIPWYNGYKGVIEKTEMDGSFLAKGAWERIDDTSIRVTELPILTWTKNYKEFLEELIGESKNSKKDAKKAKNIILEDFNEKHKNQFIEFELIFTSKQVLDKLIQTNTLEKELKLVKPISTHNMYLFDENLKIKKYNTPNDIISDFFNIRKEFYFKRYSYLQDKYNKELDKISAKIKFIEEIIDGTLIVFRKPKNEITEQLISKGYPKCDESYDYLTGLPIYTFTQEKIYDLAQAHQTQQELLDELLSKEPIDLWKEDLVTIL